MKKVLFNLNIIIDMLAKRNDHASAIKPFDFCVREITQGHVCSLEITTLAFFLTKEK
ncbi:MAG: hypothetical protein A4E71_00484 [Smithella sp. PtaU1.Bin162]|nr:MAG: hypothetical protein A4E71_00484 [Smithella sp. PtaU1.Bin162]